jgi:hypothetical protein
MEHNPHTLKDRLMHKIEAQEISMRPKIYFTLQIAALVLVALATLVVSIIIFNFILFSIRINSHDSLLYFGPRGFEAFLSFFPWPFLLADILLVFMLEFLVRRFRFGTRIPVLYLLLGIFLLTGVTALALDRGTDVNDRLLVRADQRQLPPPLNDFYGGARRHMSPESGVCKCVVVAIEGSKLTLRDLTDTTTIVVLLPPNDPRATTTSLRVGDMVLVAGDVERGMIRAFGLRKLSQ